MVFPHPGEEAFHDHASCHGPLGPEIVSAPARGDELTVVIETKIVLFIYIFEGVQVVIGDMIVHDVQDDGESAAVKGLDRGFELVDSRSGLPAPASRRHRSVRRIVRFGREKSRGHVAPVVAAVGIPVVVQPERRILVVEFDVAEFLDGQQFHRVHAERREIIDAALPGFDQAQVGPSQPRFQPRARMRRHIADVHLIDHEVLHGVTASGVAFPVKRGLLRDQRSAGMKEMVPRGHCGGIGIGDRQVRMEHLILAPGSGDPVAVPFPRKRPLQRQFPDAVLVAPHFMNASEGVVETLEQFEIQLDSPGREHPEGPVSVFDRATERFVRHEFIQNAVRKKLPVARSLDVYPVIAANVERSRLQPQDCAFGLRFKNARSCADGHVRKGCRGSLPGEPDFDACFGLDFCGYDFMASRHIVSRSDWVEHRQKDACRSFHPPPPR